MARGGLGGLVSIVVIAGGLYFSGAGGWVLQRIQPMGAGCYRALGSMPSVAQPVCAGVSRGVDIITRLSDRASASIHQSLSQFGIHWGNSLGGLNTDGISNPFDSLKEMIARGPQQLSGSLSEQFQQAVDSYNIGQHYASEGNATQAMPWLKMGAQQSEGYGLLSQLSLGDLYRNGAPGVAPNSAQAAQYYRQAANSLNELSASNRPEAQQLLQTLHASPQAMQQQLLQTVKQLEHH